MHEVKKIRCLIIDDKPLALDILADYVNKVPFLELVHQTQNPLEGLDWVQTGRVDLIFLDIQMPEITGLQFLNIIKGTCQVIMTTAYAEYALDGYEHDVVDYLMKPYAFDRFYNAVEKAKHRFLPLPVALASFSSTITSVKEKSNDYIFIKTEHKIQNVPLQSILFLEAMQNYVIIHTETGKLVTLQALKQFEEKLPSPQFVRVHKSYLVAVSKIECIERSRIFIKQHIIPVGSTYRDAFFQLLGL